MFSLGATLYYCYEERVLRQRFKLPDDITVPPHDGPSTNPPPDDGVSQQAFSSTGSSHEGHGHSFLNMVGGLECLVALAALVVMVALIYAYHRQQQSVEPSGNNNKIKR